MTVTASPLYLGNHPAVDFLNTAFAPDGVQMEAIPDGHTFIDWMVGVGLLEESLARKLVHRFGAKAMDSTAVQARKMREHTRRWLGRFRVAPERDYKAEIAALNEQLARGAWRRELAVGDEGLTSIEQLQMDSPDSLLAMVAWQITTLVTQEELSLLKQCEGAGCTLWFLDRTKAHRQRFCSAAVCGNRAKVAAFRERQRG